MTIDFSIDEKDFLTNQLYMASKSDRIRKKRKRNRIILPLIYVAFGILFLFTDKLPLTIIFLIIGLLWYIVYPIYEKRYYIKHYQGFIKDNYKERIGKTSSLEINDDFIIGKDSGSESKILTKELEEINEIPTTIFVKLKTGQSLILPKNKIKNIDLLIIRLKQLASSLNIPYNLDEKWEWK